MSMRHEENDIYIIPPNFIDTGTVFGGTIKLRNAAEALAVFFGLCFLFRFFPSGFLLPDSFRFFYRGLVCILLQPHHPPVFQVYEKVDDKGGQAFAVYTDDGEQGCREYRRCR